MKSKKSFFFLHFIIFSYTVILCSPSNPQCPNYSLIKFWRNFLQNDSMSLSILTKEFLHSKILSDFSYFITTLKAGIISIIKNNKILFSIDLNKKIYKTYFQQEIVMKGNNVTLPMEGKLFRVFPGRTNLEENLEIDNFELDNFEELTTPIRELVDMTPFSFWFNQDYHYDGNKNYSIIKLINKNKMNNFDINLDEIIFVDYNLIYLKNNDQIWNTIVTNVFFTGDN